MKRNQAVRSALATFLQHKRLQFTLSSFQRSKLHNDITLKPLVKEFAATNRYKIHLESIREFLNTEVIEVGDILHFASRLFATIDLDVKVLADNERVREESEVHLSRILVLDKELQQLKSEMLISSEEIRSLDEMLEFTGGIFGNYNKKLTQAKQIYEETCKMQICTTLDVESAFDVGVTEDYYLKYHPQLVDVLVRMRKSLESLSQEIKLASNVDLPLRCHNFLVNCRNLIFELEGFIVDRSCVFNKLLSYVITQQQRTLNDLVGIATSKSKISLTIYQVIEKNFYMSSLFEEEVRKIEGQMDISKAEIQTQFQKRRFRDVERASRGAVKQIEQHLHTIKEIKGYLTDINEDYMRQMTKAQFNTRMRKLITMKEKVREFESFIRILTSFRENDDALTAKQDDLRREGERMSTQLSSLINKTVTFTEEGFQKIFMEIQERLLELSAVKGRLLSSNSEHSDNQLTTEYIETKVSEFHDLQESYFRIEKSLIGLYEEHKRGYQEETQKNIGTADGALQRCRQFLESVDPSQEGDIWTWEKRSLDKETYHMNLIVNAQGKINQESGQFSEPEDAARKKETLEELSKMKLNFEALLRLYGSSVNPASLTGIVSKFSFDSNQEVNRELMENKQYMDEIQEYFNEVKENEARDIRSNLFPNIHQANKERMRVMEEVVATFSLFFQVYEKLKLNPEPEELRNKYVAIGNEKILKYLTLQYISRKELLNRIKQIKENRFLKEKTKEFFDSRISDFLAPLEFKLSMDELYNYIDLLKKGAEFGVVVQDLINDLIKKANSPNDQLYKPRVVGAAHELSDLKKDILRLEDLDGKILGKLSYGNLKSEMKKVQDFLSLAQQIVKEKNSSRMILDLPTIKDQRAKELRNKITNHI